MTAVRRLSSFTSEKARKAFMTKYEAALDERWLRRHERAVSTAFGTTRVMTDGGTGDGGAPFVLLPGSGGNSLMWHRHVDLLGRVRPLIAIDPVGDPGGSSHDRPFADGRDLAAWLDEVLAALGVDRAHVIGASYGGWVAVQHALHIPGRTATLTLLDPGGFGRITGKFVWWVIAGGLASFAPAPVRRGAARRLRNATLLDDDIMRLVRLSTSFRRRMPMPPPLTDAELTSVTAPTQLLLGEHSAMYDASRVRDRVTALMPHVRVEIIPGASHDVPMHSVELVTTRAIEFARHTETAA
jgi:pimeloyl-ACP methyl ester carboxylesterase